jgi:phage shock protein C
MMEVLTMYCWSCGRQLEEVANYCSTCGAARAVLTHSAGSCRETSFRRIREGKKIAGVCGGVARYFDIDVTLVRILWILLTICPPLPGLIAYVVCWIAMPPDALSAPASSTASATAPGARA